MVLGMTGNISETISTGSLEMVKTCGSGKTTGFLTMNIYPLIVSGALTETSLKKINPNY